MTPKPNIERVLWDLIGVYFTDGRKQVIEHIAAHVNRPYSEVATVMTKGALNTYVKTGRNRFSTYLEMVAQKLHVTPKKLNELDMKDVWFSQYTPREGMEDLVKEIATQGIVNDVLSNNIDVLVKDLQQRYLFKDHFELCTLSFNVGVRKPAQKMYETAITVADYEGKENRILFIDDKISNLHVPREKGIHTLHVDPKKPDRDIVIQLRKDFRHYGIKVEKK